MENISWVIGNSFLSIRERYKELIINLRWLFVVYILYEIFFWSVDYFPTLEKTKLFFDLSISSIVYYVGDLVILALVAIRVHRTLLPSKILKTRSVGLISSSESTQRYLIRGFCLLVIFTSLIWVPIFSGFTAPIYLSTFFDQFLEISPSIYFVIWLVIPVFVFYKIIPLVLVLPSIANYEPLSFSEAMKMGRKHRVLMCLVILVFPVLIVLALYLPFILFEVEWDSLMLVLISAVSYFLYTILEVAFLSAAFARLKSLQNY